MLYRGGGLETRGLGRKPQAGSGAAAPGRVRGGSPAKKFFVFSFRIYLFLSVSSHPIRCLVRCMLLVNWNLLIIKWEPMLNGNLLITKWELRPCTGRALADDPNKPTIAGSRSPH